MKWRVIGERVPEEGILPEPTFERFDETIEIRDQTWRTQLYARALIEEKFQCHAFIEILMPSILNTYAENRDDGNH